VASGEISGRGPLARRELRTGASALAQDCGEPAGEVAELPRGGPKPDQHACPVPALPRVLAELAHRAARLAGRRQVPGSLVCRPLAAVGMWAAARGC
jgi:hypothetical protein